LVFVPIGLDRRDLIETRRIGAVTRSSANLSVLDEIAALRK
jgi:hypothetical protein